MKNKKAEYQAFQCSSWVVVFHLQKLADIVDQSNDFEFADILSRVYEDTHTSTSIENIEDSEDTGTFTWPEKCVNSYLIIYLAGNENTKAVEQLNSEKFIIRAEDSSKDVETITFKIK